MRRLFPRAAMVLVMYHMTTMVLAQDKLGLEKALEIALKNNFDIQVAENDKAIAENNLTLGNAGFYPVVEANFDQNFGLSSFEQQLNNGEERSDDGVRNSRRSYGVSLNWTLFDGLRMFKAYDQLNTMDKMTDDQLRASVETLVFNLSSTFYQAALEKERLRLFEGNVKLSEERLSIAKDKYELGKASKLEYLQAQVDYNSDKSAMIQQAELLAITKFSLLELMAQRNDSINFEVDYVLDIDRNLSLDELLTVMEVENPQLLATRKAEIVARYEEEITRSERLPTVAVFADYTHQSFESPANFAIEGTSDQVNYGLTARVTLFNGLNLNRRIQNAKISSESARLAYQQQSLTFETNLKQTFLSYSNNLNLMKLESENLQVARENNDIAQERYEIGLSNPVELRESQVNLINAELRYQDAAFAAKQAEVELKFLAGILLKNKE